VINGVCDVLCESVSLRSLKEKKDLSYQHQTWYTLAVIRNRGQKVTGQGHAVMRCADRRGYAGQYDCIKCGVRMTLTYS